MTIWTLLFANIRFRAGAALFNAALLALGIAMILTFGHLDAAMKDRFNKDLAGFDLVIGGKGSPLQIILSTVFHIDTPTGNIPLAAAEKIAASRLVKTAIPMALGDNYQGYRIVGTTPDYIAHYNGKLATGHMFSAPMEAVAGAEVAAGQQLRVGTSLVGAHGLVGSADLHADTPYTLTGILAPTGTVLDRLVLTPVASVWQVHEHEEQEHGEHADHEEHADHKEHAEHDEHADEDGTHPRELTAMLLSYRSPMAAAQLPRLVNAQDGLQAASPAFEMARLNRLTGTGRDVLMLFGGVMAALAGIGFFIFLYNAVTERIYDIALLRILGLTRPRLAGLILAEVMLLAIGGYFAGLALSQACLMAMRHYVAASRHIFLATTPPAELDLIVLMAVLGIAFIAALIPAARAYKLDLAATLAKGRL